VDTKRVVVVGGGISGLTVAFEVVERARVSGAPIEVSLFDGNDWPGGKIRTFREDGWKLEWGPNGFLDSKPQTLALVDRLGASGRLLPSSDDARKRYILSRGKLRRLPESPGAFLASRLLSWRGKLRVLREPWAAPRPEGVDETVADFARRRLGDQALARLIGPMVSGVFAGDPDNLALSAAFPRMVELETQYGGLFRAMKTIGRERRAARQRGEAVEKVSAGPGGRLTSLLDGLGELPELLAGALGERVRLRTRATGLRRGDSGVWRVSFSDGSVAPADVVVLATPAYATAELLREHAPAAAQVAAAVPYARLAVVALGFAREGFPHGLDGFGFLVPREERRRILGSLWTSSIFPGARAPEGRVLLRTMVGGALAGELLDLDDQRLLALVRGELADVMGVRGVEPVHVRISRHERAIPGYPPGHLQRLAEMEQALLATAPGLLVAGNAWRGIGLNDCVRAAAEVAARAFARATGQGDGRGFLTF
jgi:oxygen-dependent protoporphyrinogen oxidase